MRLIAPMMPHLASEILADLAPAGAGSPDLTWPAADPTLTAQSTMTVAVQVGGKLRATIEAPIDASQEAVIEAAAAEPNVLRLLSGRRVIKRIYVPGRIVNFVVADPA